jgi:uncharacterized membrane protein HdeD (DUF308 family)
VFLLEGIAAILIGILLLTDPAATVVAITVFLGFYWLFVGVLELVRMFVDRSVPWIWSLLIGIVGIAAGVLVLNHPLFAAVPSQRRERRRARPPRRASPSRPAGRA